MKAAQITATILWLAVGWVCLGTGSSQASESFRDDFTTPDPTNPGREPVTWITGLGDGIVIENESLVVGDSSGNVGGANVDGFLAQEVFIESQFRILEGTNAGIGLKREEPLPGVGGNITASSNPFSPMHVQLLEGSDVLVPAVPVDFDASTEDVVMRLQVLDGQMSLWAWPADEAMPDEPLVTAARLPGLTDGVGVYVDDIGGGTVSRAEFRYFEAVVVPEPSSSLLLGLALLSLASYRRQRSR